MDGDSSQQPLRLTGDDPLSGLSAWLAEGRVDDAAAERTRQRWLERQAAADATVAGVLLDLAERGSPVTVRTLGGRTARGRVAALGVDFVAVREPSRGDVVIPTGRVATVRTAPGEDPTVGDRPPTLDVALVDALVELAVDRPPVLVSVAGDELRGDLHSAGTDVIALRLDAVPPSIVHVAIAALDHLVLRVG
ncbi:MAG: hypothetical protein RIB98_00485 [Acidimicrobiales bacterium]